MNNAVSGLREVWKNGKVAILLIVAFVVVIVLIAVISLSAQKSTGFANEESVDETTTLDNIEWSKISDMVESYTETSDLQIRSGTYQESGEDGAKTTTFIIDSEEKQASMEVTYYEGDENNDQSIVVNCVEPSLSKYPDVACDGVFNGLSTLEVVLGDDLPFYIKLSNGVTIVVEKGTEGTMHFLELEGQFCGNDKLKSEAVSKLKSLISENYDINAEMFNYQTSDLCSDDGE